MEPTDHNLRAWDELHRPRATPPGEPVLPGPVRHALSDLNGKRVLAIQCGTGESAAQLAELGATVTGVDSSAEALGAARERWPRILWIVGEPQALPRELRRGRFDLVYAGWNIEWLDDLDAWATGIAAALVPGTCSPIKEQPKTVKCDNLPMGIGQPSGGFYGQGRSTLGVSDWICCCFGHFGQARGLANHRCPRRQGHEPLAGCCGARLWREPITNSRL